MKDLEILALAVAAAGSLFTLLLWLNARKTIRNQTYMKLLEDYSTPAMLAAVKGLTDLRYRCGQMKIPVEIGYRHIDRRDRLAYQKASYKDRDTILTSSINNKRRIVAHFYYRLSAIIKTRVLPESYIFRYWTAGGLSLIPEVIDRLHLDDDKELDQLYQQAVRYGRRRRGWVSLGICLIIFSMLCQIVII